MLEALVNALRAPDIRRRILFVLGMLVIYRCLAHIPVPASTSPPSQSVLDQNDFLQLLNIFSGGGLSNFSIVALGVNPYINASIIMQLMTGVVPRLQNLSREGEYGRNKINQYTRYLTVPLAHPAGLRLPGPALSASGHGRRSGRSRTSTFASLETWMQIITLTAGTDPARCGSAS